MLFDIEWIILGSDFALWITIKEQSAEMPKYIYLDKITEAKISRMKYAFLKFFQNIGYFDAISKG